MATQISGNDVFVYNIQQNSKQLHIKLALFQYPAASKKTRALHFSTGRGASIKPGTWNIPEHAGRSRNIPEHEKIKIIFMKKIKNNSNNKKIIFIKINNNIK